MTENRPVVAGGPVGGNDCGENYKGTCGNFWKRVINMFIILISVIVSQVHTYVKTIKLYTTNMCSLFMLLYTSLKLF